MCIRDSSSKPVIFLFPGTCCLYSSFEHVLDGLHSYFYTVIVSYDGFDPNEKTEFYSMEDECEKIELEIKKKMCIRDRRMPVAMIFMQLCF